MKMTLMMRLRQRVKGAEAEAGVGKSCLAVGRLQDEEEDVQNLKRRRVLGGGEGVQESLADDGCLFLHMTRQNLFLDRGTEIGRLNSVKVNELANLRSPLELPVLAAISFSP